MESYRHLISTIAVLGLLAVTIDAMQIGFGASAVGIFKVNRTCFADAIMSQLPMILPQGEPALYSLGQGCPSGSSPTICIPITSEVAENLTTIMLLLPSWQLQPCPIPEPRFVFYDARFPSAVAVDRSAPRTWVPLFPFHDTASNGVWALTMAGAELCGSDLSRHPSKDSVGSLSSGLTVVLDPLLPLGCVILPLQMRDAVMLRLNASCQDDGGFQCSLLGFTPTLRLISDRDGIQGWAVPLTQSSGRLCVGGFNASDEYPSARVSAHGLKYANFTVDLQLMRLAFDNLTTVDSCPVAAPECSHDEAYIASLNRCVAAICDQIWYKELDPDTFECRSRGSVVGFVAFLLCLICFGESIHSLIAHKIEDKCQDLANASRTQNDD